MLRSSIPLGRFAGVDVRLHLSFPILLVAAVVYGIAATGNAMRGVGLFAALVLAVGVREVARAIAAAYVGLRLRALFLLPIGGVMAYAPQPAGTQISLRPLTLAAPLANFGMGLLLLAVSYACAPGAQLLIQPWVSAGHVLRSFIWMQIIIGTVNLLPTSALPTRHMVRPNAGSAGAGGASRPLFGLIPGIAFAMLLAGIFRTNIPLFLAGTFVLLYSQLQSQAAAAPAASEIMRVDEVMLTDFVMLSSSDTLRGALDRTVHSLQDVFPVVRGNRLVGSVSRQTLADHLQAEGDGYLQGVMTRSLQLAAPEEQLVDALRRAAARGASEFIPVVADDRMLGILTPQSLGRAVQQVKSTRPAAEEREPRP